MKKWSVSDILYTVFAAFVCTCYACFALSTTFKGTWKELPVAFAVLALAILPILFRKKLQKWLGKVYRPLKYLFIAGMCFYTVTFIAFSAVVVSVGNSTDPKDPAEGETPVIVVFGCRAFGDTPGVSLRYRLDVAAVLMERYPDALCIVSGAQGQNESAPESFAMMTYLTKVKGFDPARVVEEPQGYNTLWNLRYSKAITEERGLTDPHFYCVSSEFHTPRILYISAKMGMDRVDIVHAPSDGPFRLFTSLVREYMSYVYLLLFVKI